MPAKKSGTTPRKKKGRRGRLVVITVVLLLVAGVGYGSYWGVSTVRDSFPQTTGSLKLPGLSDPVQVQRDGSGVPQIYADTNADLFRAQGYVQAQDRFWEMDVRRHMTSGRLSEMFGKSQVDTDAFLRTLGWHRVAQEEYDHKLSARTKSFLRSYSAGVNAYLKEHQGKAISLEYAELGLSNDYKPQKWTPVDSVAWLKAMAWDLRGNMQDEIDRSLMSTRFTQKQIAELYPSYPYDRNKPIVQQGSVNPVTKEFDPNASQTTSSGTGTGTSLQSAEQGLAGQLSSLSGTMEKVPSLMGPTGSGVGSNSWVVSGKYTTTGKPLLANDPHLAPQMPSLWYQMGLHCRTLSKSCDYDVSGYTFSGMPGVVIGHNQNISWGMTNLGADVSDLYLEKINEDGYLYDGKQLPFITRKETIKVAGGKSRRITVRSTKDGPIVSDRDGELADVGKTAPVGNSAPDRGNGYAISLKWTALSPGKSMDAVFALDKANDFDQFRSAAHDFEVPSQNLIYADTKGNIGYQAPGRIPMRPDGDTGDSPVPGWDPRYKWQGYIPQSALPWEENPEQGYIVTANQAVVDQSKYPYHLTDDWDYGTRSQRITDLIQSKISGGGKISMDDMQAMQMDDSSEIAKLLTPYLLKIDVKDPYVRQAQQLLEGWDYTQDSDSAAAAYFNATWRNVLKLAFGDKMPKELRAKGQCLYVHPAGDTAPADEDRKLVRECGERDADSAQPDGGDRWFEVVRGLLGKPHSSWWTSQTNGKTVDHDRDQLLAHALTDARYELTAKLGKNTDTWSWGRLHQLTLKNQTLGTDGPGAFQGLYNRGPYNLGGGEAAVDATGWNAAGGYEVTWVPSMRMVVNLADLDKSRWINLTGASGHAYDAHYDDQTEKWSKGELLPWAFSQSAVKKSTKDTLTLSP